MTSNNTTPQEGDEYISYDKLDSCYYDDEQLPPGVRSVVVPEDLQIAHCETIQAHCNPNASDKCGDESYEFVDFWELWGLRPQTKVQEVEAIGDSMMPLIVPGDRIFYSPDIIPQPGSLVVVWYHGNCLAKHLYVEPDTGHCFLYSENSAYAPIPMTYSENVKLLGVAFDVHRSLLGNNKAQLIERHRAYQELQKQRAAKTNAERFVTIVNIVNNATDRERDPLITHCRDWSIVMRIMAQIKLFPANEHTAFVRKLRALTAEDHIPCLSIRKLPADASTISRTLASISGDYPRWRQPDDCDDDLWQHYIDIAECTIDAINRSATD